MIVSVVHAAAENSPDAVLAEIDHFWDYNMQGLGSANWQQRSKLLESILLEQQPTGTLLELGTYCGATAVRLGRLMNDDAMLVTIERDPLFAAIATKIVEHAGLSQKVKVLIGSLETQIERVAPKLGVARVDTVLLDQPSSPGSYLKDLQRLEAVGLIQHDGAVAVCDTTVYPGDDFLQGIQEYTDYMEAASNWETKELQMGHPWGIKLGDESPPQLLVSTFASS